MQFTNDDLDRTLETVKSAVGRIGSTLFELDAERGRRAVEAGRLTGGSAQAWDQAGEDLLTMWASYQALSEKISAVEAERGAKPFSRAAANRITEELLGPSTQADISALSSAAGAYGGDHDFAVDHAGPGRAPVG